MKLVKELNNSMTFKNIAEAARWVHTQKETRIGDVLTEDPTYEAIKAVVNDVKDKSEFQLDLIAGYRFIGIKAEANKTVGYMSYDNAETNTTTFEYDN